MSEDKNRNGGVLALVVALVVVLIGGVLFVGAVSGWFDDPKVVLDAEYYSDDVNYMELEKEGYENLTEAKKSFIVFVDQVGCTTADRLREYMMQYMKEKGILVYKMMFSDMKETSLHEEIKYYPSVAIIDKGVVKAYLRADSDEDAEKYNNYDVLKEWLNLYL